MKCNVISANHRASNCVAALCVFLSFAVVMAILGYGAWERLAPYAPLGAYPEQQVVSRVEGVEMPAVHLGQPVIMIATKCVTAEDAVAVRTDVAWVARGAEQPHQRVPLVSNGAAIRQPGCETWVFHNRLPPEVGPGLWRLEGVEMATRGDGRTQVKTFQSEEFRVLE